MLFQPGYLSTASMAGVMSAKGQESERHTCETLMRSGMFICGSVETVRRLLLEHYATMRFGVLLPMFQFGTLPTEETRQSMALFAAKIAPALREAAPLAS